MDETSNNRDTDKIIAEGIVSKSANLETQEVTDQDLQKINKFTLEPLKAEEVFTFKLVMGDNEVDDRNYEPFNLNALKDLKRLYVGKTMIKDHSRKADNQIARIYDTELVQDTSKITGAGEFYTKLIAKCYMIKTVTNTDLISEIKAGIKKEVSTSCVPKHAYCSICGTDNTKSYCSHFWGREYDTKDGKKTCYFTLDGAKEAYEVSFVAVPAQRRAGTTKRYGEALQEKTEENNKEKQEEKEQTLSKEQIEKEKETELDLKIKSLVSFLFFEKEKGEDENE